MRSVRPKHPRHIHEHDGLTGLEIDELEKARTRVRRTNREVAERNAKPMTPTEKSDSFTAAITFVLGSAICVFLFFAQPYLLPRETYWLVCDSLLIFVPFLAITFWFKADLHHFGLTHGDRKLGMKYTAIAVIAMLPLLVIASLQPQFRSYYEAMLAQPFLLVGAPVQPPLLGRPLQIHPAALAFYEVSQGFYLFCWEFFFRGFLLFGFLRARQINPIFAVILQAIPFTLLHWSIVPAASKPLAEILSAAVGGLILGWLAIKTRTFFYGFVIHWAIAGILDLLLIVSLAVRPA